MVRQYKKIAENAAGPRHWWLFCQHDSGYFLSKHHALGPSLFDPGINWQAGSVPRTAKTQGNRPL
jgi:hypothetical protein